MSLAKDIHQLRDFRNEHHKAMVNLIFTHHWLYEKLRDFIEKENITLQQYNILRILRGSDCPLSTQQIRERMLDRMSDTSRLVDRMVLKELVQKHISKTDQRKVDITISTKGKALLKRLDQLNKPIDAILSGLTDTEAKTLNRLLDKMRSSEK